MPKTEAEDGTIVAVYMPTLDMAAPFDEQMAINVAERMDRVIFFYTTPEAIGLAEESAERWERL